MGDDIFVWRSRLHASAEDAFAWHARPGALERLTPPWAPVEIVERHGGIEDGARVVLRIPVGPARVRWVAEHRGFVPGREFRDVQVAGPFACWEHTHRFDPDGPDACVLEDRIVFALPLAPFGGLIGKPLVHRMLARTFAYRHRVTDGDLLTHARYAGPPLHVAVSGASGLIGSALVPFLTTGGHRVTRLVRGSARGPDTATWDPETGAVDLAGQPSPDAVVHLAGENIAGGRWTPAMRARLGESRVGTTRRLCETLARLAPRPRVLVCASAVGFYGDRGAEVLEETSAAGDGFLADLCREWEAATAPAADAGIRVVNLRLGMVLSARGGALARLLPPFLAGLGGRVGSGRQFTSWIGLDDVLGAVLHCLRTADLHGPVNAVAPHPVTNAEFTRVVGGVLGRPTLLPLPAAALRLVLGDMADELLLASARVVPTRLLSTGYVFRDPDLAGALRHTLGRGQPGA